MKIFQNSAILFISLIIFIFGGYFFYQLKNFIFGPSFNIAGLKEYTVVYGPFFVVEGNAKNIFVFYLNGRKVFMDKEGNFKEKMVLASGSNILEFKARDKFGHEATKYYHLFNKNVD